MAKKPVHAAPMPTKTAPSKRIRDNSPKNVGPEWERLARYMIRRRADLGLSQETVARRAGLSKGWLQPVETLRSPFLPSAANLRRVSTALGWTDESIAQILAGGEPEEAGVDTAKQPAGQVDALLLADLVRLRNGDLTSFLAVQTLVRSLASRL